VVGCIADTPQIVLENGEKYMVFRLAEVAGTEFRLKMFPMTPERHKGEWVELTHSASKNSSKNGTVTVETLHASPKRGGRP
jgi:hypothetical protein